VYSPILVHNWGAIIEQKYVRMWRAWSCLSSERSRETPIGGNNIQNIFLNSEVVLRSSYEVIQNVNNSTRGHTAYT
jgi:hypothetical protein